MTVKAREKHRMRISHRITLTIKRDSIGECDQCHNRRDLYNDNTQDGNYRLCADCWAGSSDTLRRANGMPY
jgi:hypothetical protein